MDKNLLIILSALLVFVVASAIILNFMSGNENKVTIGVWANGGYRGIVSGAKVDLFNMSPEGQPAELIATAYTGDDGIAKFDNIPVSGWMYAIATKEGYVSSKKNISESDKRSGLIEMSLREKTYASIDVYERAAYTDYTNKPISGVSIKAYLENDLLGENYTDSSGRAVIGNLPLYSYVKIKISKEGYEDMERTLYVYQGGRDTAYLTKSTNEELSVIVKSDQYPVSSAKVVLFDYVDGYGYKYVKTAYTSSNGVADFGLVGFDKSTVNGVNQNKKLEVSKEGYVTSSVYAYRNVQYGVYLSKLTAVNNVGWRAKITLLDCERNSSRMPPLAGAKVEVYTRTENYGYKLIRENYTDSSGVVDCGMVNIKAGKLVFSKSGYETLVYDMPYYENWPQDTLEHVTTCLYRSTR